MASSATPLLPTAGEIDADGADVAPSGGHVGRKATGSKLVGGGSVGDGGDGRDERIYSTYGPGGHPGVRGKDVDHRLLDRKGVFHQSLGTFRCVVARLSCLLGAGAQAVVLRCSRWRRWRRRIERENKRWWRRALYVSDVFHTTLHFSTGKLLVALLLMYVVTFLAFAFCYWIADTGERCGTGMVSYVDAYMFSVETMITIGYGVPEPYFNGCADMAVLVTAQSVVGCFFDAICIGLLYDRLSRAQTRANTIAFTKNAALAYENGSIMFNFRVMEVRKHQMVEAHVRAYAVRHTRKRRNGPLHHFQAQELRIHNPNDEVGAMLLLVLPFEVQHRLDEGFHSEFPRSPLLPTAEYLSDHIAAVEASRGIERPAVTVSAEEVGEEGVQLVGTGAAAAIGTEPPAPGVSALRRRPSMLTRGQSGEGFWGVDAPGRTEAPSETAAQLYERFAQLDSPGQWELIRGFWEDRQMEVIVLVEGIDAVTSDTCQARHSYTVRDVFWQHEFVPCVNKHAAVDFERFHDMQPIED